MQLRLWKHPNNGVWYAVGSKDGRTHRTSLRTRDKAAAQQRLIDLGRVPTGPSVGCAAAIYLAERAAIPSAERIRSCWKKLEPWFGHLRPDQVTRASCKAYAAARYADGVKPGTVRTELGMLKSALLFVDPNSPANIELPAAPFPKDRRLTRAEFKALMDSARSPHMRLFILLALSCGGRRSAVLELTWDRVDFETGLIRLSNAPGRGKGRATVPMTDSIRQALLDARRVATTATVIEYAGRPVGSIKKAFARTCERAGLPDVTPHTLRHTAASWMAEAGVSMPEIASFLGHSDDRITQRVYAKFSPAYLRTAAQALEF